MAGDWIKVEKSTLNKPEVRAISRLMGVSVQEALGTLLAFWCWLDDVLVDAHVDACVDADVDAQFGTGFSAALKVVGWATFERSEDGLTGRMLIANSGRHFGETSKKRALKSERQARWRANHVDAHVDAPVDAVASTRKEKKRTISTNVDIEGATKKTRRQIVEPSLQHRELATSLGLDCQTEFQKFRDWLAANGRQQKDEEAGFRNWLRKAADFRPRVVSSHQHDKRAATAAAMLRTSKRDSNEPTDITAEAVRVA